MKILVTGAEGFIGGYLMPELSNAVGLDIKRGESENILTCRLPDEVDVVIHLAAIPGVIASVENPYKNAETNILGTIRLLQKYKQAKFIFASSGGTIQETIESPYGLSKKTCEEYIKLLHDNYVILRFCNVYGKGSRSVVDKWLKEEELTIYGDGETYRIYGHVSDVVKAIIKSIDWPTGTYSLGSAQRYSVNQVADAITGYKRKPVHHLLARPGEITHPNSQLLNTTPNWMPRVNLMEYIHDQLHNPEQK